MQLLLKLRDLLAQPPTRRRWDLLCDLLEDASPEELPLALDYARDHLERWPDALREAPGHWLAAAVRGEPAPLLTLVRSLRPLLLGLKPLQSTITDVSNPSEQREALFEPELFRALLSAPELAALRAIELPRVERGVKTTAALALASSPLRQLSSLSLQGTLDAAIWERLLQGSGRAVERWQLTDSPLPSEVLDLFEVAEAQPWRHLTLNRCKLPVPGGLRRLIGCAASTLEALSLYELQLYPAPPGAPIALDDLASLQLPRLRSLSLRCQQLTLPALSRLGEPAALPALTELTLVRCELPEQGMEALLAQGLAQRLTSLVLDTASVDFAEALGADALPQLRSLKLYGRTAEALILTFLERAPGLERLTLTDIELTPAIADALSRLPLRELDVSQCTGRLDMSRLLALGRFHPERLRLVVCGVQSEDLLLLAQSDALKNLRSLDLAGAVLDDASLEALAASPCRDALEELLLYASWHGPPATWTLAGLRHANFTRLHTLSLTPRSIQLSELKALLASPLLSSLDDLLVAASTKPNALDEEAGAKLWGAAPLPLHVKAMPFAGPWGWGLADLLRLPPSLELLKNLRWLLKLHPPLQPEERARLCARVARWWPAALREEALLSLNAGAGART